MASLERRDDGVDAYQASTYDLDTYRRAEANLERLQVPVFIHGDNIHERLYVVALDGTGNSKFDDDPKNWTAVARIHDQIEKTNRRNIASGYVEGTFTQDGLIQLPAKLVDGRFGQTFTDRIETAYLQLCVKAKEWLSDDPEARIRLVGVGFSRGSEELAALQRVVHERGVLDPDGADFRLDGEKLSGESLVTSIEYASVPKLVAPGKTLQAALLFDPVSTGVEEHDRRLPSSTLSTFQIGAIDERRNLFKANDHVLVGLSERYRNLNAPVAGAHSDIGSNPNGNGISILSFNLGVNFLNRLSDHDYLQMEPLPEDPAMYVIHRSEQGMFGLYGTSSFTKDGLRDHVNQLAPAELCRDSQPIDCRRKEPISEELDAQVERRTGPSRQRAPVLHDELQDSVIPKPPSPTVDSPAPSTWHPLFQQMTDAAMSGNAIGIEMAGRAYAHSAEGQAWLGQGQQLNDALAQQAEHAQQQAAQQAMEASEAQTQRGPVMRM